MKNRILFTAGLVACSLFAFAFAADPPKHEHEPAPAKEAVCVLVPQQNSGVSGTLVLKQADHKLHITGEIAGLKPGKHGFHVHNYGDLRSADGSSAGGHYAPDGHHHGGPGSSEHHAGDLGNITAGDDGVAKVDIVSKDLHLHFIIGRSMVVHADVDDLTTDPSGKSGARIGVGVIGVANTDPPKK